MTDDPLLLLIGATLGIDPTAINELSDMTNTRKWDSLRQIILMTEVETQYEIELTEQEILATTSVAKIRSLLERVRP